MNGRLGWLAAAAIAAFGGTAAAADLPRGGFTPVNPQVLSSARPADVAAPPGMLPKAIATAAPLSGGVRPVVFRGGVTVPAPAAAAPAPGVAAPGVVPGQFAGPLPTPGVNPWAQPWPVFPVVTPVPPIAVQEAGRYSYRAPNLWVNPWTSASYQPLNGVVNRPDGTYYRVPGTGTYNISGGYVTGSGLYHNPTNGNYYNPRTGTVGRPGTGGWGW